VKFPRATYHFGDIMSNELTLPWIVALFIGLKLVDIFMLNVYIPNNFTSGWAKAIANLFLAGLIIYDLDKNQNIKVISIYFAVICLIEFFDVVLDSVLDLKKVLLMKKNK
jgi:hypothetical protein